MVLPARDEERNLESVIDSVLAHARPFVSELEILVVDDGSEDGTARLVERLRAVTPELRLVSHRESRGYGAALRSGFAAARFEWIFLTDADGQFPLVELPRALRALASYDAVVGYRVARADELPRRLLGRAWTELVRNVTGLGVRDANCAFKLFPRRVVANGACRSDGAAISAEILVALANAGLRTLELGVSHRPRASGTQTGARPSVAVEAFVELASMVRRAKRAPALQLVRGDEAHEHALTFG